MFVKCTYSYELLSVSQPLSIQNPRRKLLDPIQWGLLLFGTQEIQVVLSLTAEH